MTIAFIGVVLVSWKTKNIILFMKIVVVILIVVAIVSPWWEMNGSSSVHNLDTSTKFFIMPTKMVSITSNSNVTAGEIGTLEQDLTQIVDTVLPPVILATIVYIFISIMLDKYNIKRLSSVVLLTGVIFYIGVIVIYLYEMSRLANSIVGSLIGGGDIEIMIPGEKIYQTLSCSWGPGIGFYLILTATILLIFTLVLYIKRHFSRKKA
jgi:hypothetical protein